MVDRILYKRILMLLLGTLISSFGMALLVKSNLGQSTVGALSYNLGVIFNVRMGTILAIVNYLCFIGQIVILKRNFKAIRIFQLFITTVFASAVNMFLYDVSFISNLSLNNYLLRIVVLFLGIVSMSYGVSLTIAANLVILPFEAFFYEIALKFRLKFGSLRRVVDLVIVITTLLIIYGYNIPNISVREGTIIYTLLFGTLINFFNKFGINKQLV